MGGMESVDHPPSSLTHDPRVYSRLLTEEDLRKEREHNKDDKKMENHNEHKQEREHKDYKESSHHKEPEERERHSPNRSKPDPQLLLQALTPRDLESLSKLRKNFHRLRYSKEFGQPNLHIITSSIFESLPYSKKLMDSYEYVYGDNRRGGQALLS